LFVTLRRSYGYEADMQAISRCLPSV
jgi:hypothetical protein